MFYISPLGGMYTSKEGVKIRSSRGLEEHLKDGPPPFQKSLDPPMPLYCNYELSVFILYILHRVDTIAESIYYIKDCDWHAL
jgi:hypothetical protein